MRTRLILCFVVPLVVSINAISFTPAHAENIGASFQSAQIDSTDDEALPRWLTDFRVGAYVLRIRPNGDDAENFSKPSWGGGLDFILVPSAFKKMAALQFGFEGVVFMSQQTTLIDPDTQIRTELSTSQDLVRLYMGLRLGHQGHGTLRPYVAANVAVNWYSIHSTLTIPDDFDPEDSITQDLGGNDDVGFGLDLLAGLEINIRNVFFIDFNIGYMKNYYVEQQIAENAVEISPEYFIARLGIAFSLATVMDMPDNMPDLPEDD